MRLIVYIAIVAGFLFGQATHLAAQRPTEYEVKAAFLYNFVKFAEWPDGVSDTSPEFLVIGVLGKDPFGQSLAGIVREKTVGHQKLVIRNLNSIEDLAFCQILFISSSETDQMDAHLEFLRSKPILTVSEVEGFCEAGGMINFYIQRNRVRFEINPNAASRSDIKLSSKLLKLARLVTDGPAGDAR